MRTGVPLLLNCMQAAKKGPNLKKPEARERAAATSSASTRVSMGRFRPVHNDSDLA